MTTTATPVGDYTTNPTMVGGSGNTTSYDDVMKDYPDCDYYRNDLMFMEPAYGRIAFTWVFFVFGATSNIFVLYCLYKWKRKTHVQVITLHLTLADLAFTFFIMPMDAMWQLTMEWEAGNVMCKVCQMMKQFGMYVSSLMVLVTALDRVFSILSPMSTATQQRTRTKFLLIGAWTTSFVSALPPLYVFSLATDSLCPDAPPFRQCVDFIMVGETVKKVYLFFTMAMSFIIPFGVTVVSYSLIIAEISNMLRRDREMLGRRNNLSMAKARRKTLILTSSVTLVFLLLWTPYYTLGIYQWIVNYSLSINEFLMQVLYMLLYLPPLVHPILYGFFVSDFRKRFASMFSVCIKHPSAHRSDGDSKRKSVVSRTPSTMATSLEFQRCPDARMSLGNESSNCIELKERSHPRPLIRNERAVATAGGATEEGCIGPRSNYEARWLDERANASTPGSVRKSVATEMVILDGGAGSEKDHDSPLLTRAVL